MQNAEKLDSNIIYDRDFDYDYFGFKVSSAVVNGEYCSVLCKPRGGMSCNYLTCCQTPAR